MSYKILVECSTDGALDSRLLVNSYSEFKQWCEKEAPTFSHLVNSDRAISFTNIGKTCFTLWKGKQKVNIQLTRLEVYEI